LEKILSLVSVSDPESLGACRFVGRRWNEIGVKFWRVLKTSRVEFLTDQLIYEFLSEMDFRIQDFPFARFRFISVNSENVKAVKQFLRECSTHVQDLEICQLHDSLNAEDGKEILELLSCLNTSTLPNLEELSFGLMLQPTTEIPDLAFENLRILKLPFIHGLPIAVALIKGASNLQLLEIPMFIHTQDLVWPLPEACKQIAVIEVTMHIKILVEATTTTLVTLAAKLEEWTNVHVQNLIVTLTVDHPNRTPETCSNMQRILDGQSDFIQKFTLLSFPSSFQHHLRIPTLAKLNELDLTNHDRNPLQSIEGNPFSQLHVVRELFKLVITF